MLSALAKRAVRRLPVGAAEIGEIVRHVSVTPTPTLTLILTCTPALSNPKQARRRQRGRPVVGGGRAPYRRRRAAAQASRAALRLFGALVHCTRQGFRYASGLRPSRKVATKLPYRDRSPRSVWWRRTVKKSLVETCMWSSGPSQTVSKYLAGPQTVSQVPTRTRKQ